MRTCTGTAITDDHWTANCPYCGGENEWQGFFDAEDICVCQQCKREFQVTEIIFENGSYIE